MRGMVTFPRSCTTVVAEVVRVHRVPGIMKVSVNKFASSCLLVEDNEPSVSCYSSLRGNIVAVCGSVVSDVGDRCSVLLRRTSVSDVVGKGARCCRRTIMRTMRAVIRGFIASLLGDVQRQNVSAGSACAIFVNNKTILLRQFLRRTSQLKGRAFVQSVGTGTSKCSLLCHVARTKI